MVDLEFVLRVLSSPITKPESRGEKCPMMGDGCVDIVTERIFALPRIHYNLCVS